MDLTKEQIRWLDKAKQSEIPDGNETYNNEPMLKLLIDKGLITFTTNVDDNGEFCVSDFRLTPSGEEQLSLHRENHHRWWAEHWIAPMFTGFVSGVLVTLVTTWLLGLLKLPA